MSSRANSIGAHGPTTGMHFVQTQSGWRSWRKGLTDLKGQDQSTSHHAVNPSAPDGRKGRSTVTEPRCEWCILKRKKCDGAKPVCDRCRKKPDRCNWPEGNPSRSRLEESKTLWRVEEDNPQHESPGCEDHGIGETDEESESSTAVDPQLVTAGEQVAPGYIQPSQLSCQVKRPSTTMVLTQHSPPDRQTQRNLSSEGQHDQQRAGSQDSGLQVAQRPGFKPDSGDSDDGIKDDDLFEAWLDRGVL